ncbi:interleukin-27 subunit alpha [Ambystoma mexicanum]|uniref:interleukin-27 subunit alpha n=1 Tax=Ambystoma mexicanum TaxID=8296 RepID=UPI0037E6FDDB
MLCACLHILPVCAFPPRTSGVAFRGVASEEEKLDMRREFDNSLKLARKLLAETRSLIRVFMSERLPGAHLDLMKNQGDFPKISIRNTQWLSLPIMERLRVLGDSFHVYSSYLEVIAEYERSQQHSSIEPGLTNVRLDLRDLLHHVQHQMSFAHGTPLSKPVQIPGHFLHPSSTWKAQVQALITLRHLEQFLGRAVREFTLLRFSVTRHFPTSPAAS